MPRLTARGAALSLRLFALLALLPLAAPAAAAERGSSDNELTEPENPGDWLAQYEPPEDGVETRGRLSYRLNPGSDQWPEEKRVKIIKVMDEAVWLYNRYGSFEKQLRVLYKASIPTADGNINGQIRFGKSISVKTAMHEISHTLGVGTSRRWDRMFEDKQWTGHQANRLLQAFDGREARLKGDKSHFWPYGLNHAREDSELNRVRHVLMVEAICGDMRMNVFVRQ